MALSFRPFSSQDWPRASAFSLTHFSISICIFRLTLSCFFSWQVLRPARFGQPLRRFPERNTSANRLEMTDGLPLSPCIINWGSSIRMQPARLAAGTLCLVSTTLLGFLVLAPPARAQAVLETPQQTNDRIRELSAAARVAPHDYVIGNGDLISIDVFDVKELSRDVRVSQTGTIGLPLVPVRLHVAGLTEIQAQQKITEVLEADGLVSHPEVNVTVKERKSKPITVVGAVAHPLVYQADREVTLLEVLAEAGGLANDAGDEVIVTRPVPTMTFDDSEPPPMGSADAVPLNSQPLNPEAKPPASVAPPSSSPQNTATANPPELPAPNPPE